MWKTDGAHVLLEQRTTEVLQACPETVGSLYADNGHQLVVTTKRQHADTGCCNVREVRG